MSVGSYIRQTRTGRWGGRSLQVGMASGRVKGLGVTLGLGGLAFVVAGAVAVGNGGPPAVRSAPVVVLTSTLQNGNLESHLTRNSISGAGATKPVRPCF